MSKSDKLKYHCEDLLAELAEVCSDAKNRIAYLEANVWSAKAYSIDVSIKGEKRLRDFEDGLVQKLEELHRLYVGNVQTIGGLCSQMPTEEPSAKGYLCWLSEEVSGLPNMFSGVNRNFATTTIESTLKLYDAGPSKVA
jgi:hypothetical protein